MLEHFALDIKDQFHLSNKSCNEAIGAITKPLNEAARTGLIKESPAPKVQRLGKDTRRKGVLSSKEIRSLFSAMWDDERTRVAALVSLTCGLRLGEILALKKSELGDNCLKVDASYSKVEGRKSTKNRHSRVVPLPHEVRDALLGLICANPFEEDFAFWSIKSNVPMHESNVAREFNLQLAKIGICSEPRRSPGRFLRRPAI